MISNYLITSFRILLKNKIFSIINIAGLAIGIAASLLILQYTNFETNYDNFHPKADNIYRTVRIGYNEDGSIRYKSNYTHSAQANAMKTDIPEILECVRFYSSSYIISYADKNIRENRVSFVDNSIFSMFHFPFIKAKVNKPLTEPNTAVLTESTANKYFGEKDPIGEVFALNKNDLYTITGVIKDIPENSVFKFDILLSWKSLYKYYNYLDLENNWSEQSFFTFVEMIPGADHKLVQIKHTKFFQNHGSNDDNLLQFQPLKDIYLHSSDFTSVTMEYGNITIINFLKIISIIILLLAWINYINISTARSIERSKEVGTRKIVGASRKKLIIQFISESLIINILAVFAAITIVQLIIPWFINLTGKPLAIDWNKPGLWLLLFLITIGGAILAGFYPAFILSSFKPVKILKNSYINNTGGGLIRKILVVFQISVTIVLLAGTFTISRQLSYMRNFNPGIKTENILVINSPVFINRDSVGANPLEYFYNEILEYPAIEGITSSSVIPGNRFGVGWGGLRRIEDPPEKTAYFRVGFIDENFLNLFGIELIKGRNFSADLDEVYENLILITEKSSLEFGFTSPDEAINSEISWWGNTGKIIGVMKNFHQESLKREQECMIMFLRRNILNYFCISIDSDNISELLPEIKSIYESTFPGNPFDYFMLEDYYNDQYKTDKNFGKVFGFFTILAIIIACLGILALSYYMAGKKIKEIAIRKVVGANINSILQNVYSEYLKLIIFSLFISIPVSYLIIQKWLSNYELTIRLNWQLFVIPVFVVLLIIFLTISFQIIKTARTNPADILRYE